MRKATEGGRVYVSKTLAKELLVRIQAPYRDVLMYDSPSEYLPIANTVIHIMAIAK